MRESLGSRLYLRGRRAVRGFVAKRPALDQSIGKTLVRFDLLLRRLGLVGKLLPNFEKDGSVQCHGLTFHYRREDSELARQMFMNQDYEAGTREVILDSLAPGDAFVDLGAHIGYFTLLAARRVGPTGRVYAFEPMVGTRAMLEKNLAANGLGGPVTVVSLASSDREETLSFFVAESSEAVGVAVPGDTNVTAVEATSLDVYFAKLGWPRVAVVKMDVEGQELKTLRGMRELIARNPVIKVIVEYNLGQIRRNQVDRHELLDTLTELGFRRYAAIFRTRTNLRLPEQIDELDRLAARSNVNLLAER